MKKIIFILSFIPVISYGQNFNVGVKIGESFTERSSAMWNSRSSNFLGGFSFSYSVNKKFDIELDALYSNVNYNSSYEITDAIGNDLGHYQYQNHFVEFPIIAKYNITSNKKYPILSIFTGIQINKLIYSYEKDHLDYYLSKNSLSFTNSTFNIPIGIEVKYKIINIGYRYVICKSDIDNSYMKFKENYDQIYLGVTMH